MEFRVGFVKSIFNGLGRVLERSASNNEAVKIAEETMHSNPLVMDAKATSAKLKIKSTQIKSTPQPQKTTWNDIENITKQQKQTQANAKEREKLEKAEFNEFTKKVKTSEDYSTFFATSAIRKQAEKIKNRINPFNEQNFSAKKGMIYKYLGSSRNSVVCDLLPQVSECKNADDLFALFRHKNFWDELRIPDEYKIEKLKKSHYIEDVEKQYLQQVNNDNQRLNKLYDKLVPKSVNPEVIKLENEIKALGVKEINLCDDLESGKQIKEAIEEMIKKRVSIPKSILINPLLETSTGGEYLSGKVHIHNSDLCKANYNFLIEQADFFLKSKELNELPSGVKEEYIERLNNLKSSFSKPVDIKGTLFHEQVGHGTEKETIYNCFTQPFNHEEGVLAEKTSSYAKSTGEKTELRAEIARLLMQGEEVSENQMNWYIKNHGEVPFTIPKGYSEI